MLFDQLQRNKMKVYAFVGPSGTGEKLSCTDGSKWK